MEEEKKELNVQEEELSQDVPVSEDAPALENETEQKENQEDLLSQKTLIEKLEDERPYEEIIETARLDFIKKYNKSRRLSYIMMGIVMAVAIASVIFITQEAMGFKIAGWCLIGSAVVGMLVFYIITKNRTPDMTKEYIKLVNKVFNSHNFIDSNTADVYTDEKEKFDLADLIVEGAYTNLGNIASRNLVHGKYNGQSFVVGDLGLYDNGQGRKRLSLFVGKYLTTTNSLHFEDHFIVTIKNKDKPVDLPNNVENMVALVDEDNFVICGPKDADVKKIFGNKFLSEIKKISLDENLLNANFVFWAGHSSAYLSYSDEIMTLPFQSVFTGKANNKFRQDLYDVLAVFNSINK